MLEGASSLLARPESARAVADFPARPRWREPGPRGLAVCLRRCPASRKRQSGEEAASRSAGPRSAAELLRVHRSACLIAETDREGSPRKRLKIEQLIDAASSVFGVVSSAVSSAVSWAVRMGSSPFCGGSHVPRDVLSDSPAPLPPPSLRTHPTASSGAQGTARRRLPLRGDQDILQSPPHGAYRTTSGKNEGEGTEEEYEEKEEEAEVEGSDCDVSIIGIIQTPQPNGMLRERCGARLSGDTDTPRREESLGFVGAAPRACQLRVGASAVDGRRDEFPELTKEMALAVTEASRGVDPNEVVSRHGPHCVTRQDLNTLSGTSWLNDRVIDFYLSLLSESGSGGGGVSSGAVPVYAFTTFFYTCLRDYGPASVRRWTKRVDLFAFRILLVPVHHGSHWCLVVVDICKKRITYYDPLGSSNTAACHDLLRYLCEESELKRGRPLAPREWALRGCVASGLLTLPRQSGHDDCGVFVCQFARGIARGLRVDFGQQHMAYFRWRMAWEILHARLL